MEIHVLYINTFKTGVILSKDYQSNSNNASMFFI